MFETIGAPELLIIGLVVILLFGVGKIGTVGRELGTSVKEFRRAMREDEQPAPAQQAAVTIIEAPAQIMAPQRATTMVGSPEPNRGPQIF
ncbi:MAG: twin-arginine translocase TatA/TatE family subunit [Dehalococcoidia bacterium]|nr:twin-arginine translocase TatA/TatE family subunit [Dehalococcoidia bacterium]